MGWGGVELGEAGAGRAGRSRAEPGEAGAVGTGPQLPASVSPLSGQTRAAHRVCKAAQGRRGFRKDRSGAPGWCSP